MALSRALLSVVLAASPIAGVACAVVPQTAVEIGPAAAADPSPDEPEVAAKKAAAGGPGCSWRALGLRAREDKLPLCFAVDGACFATVSSAFSGWVTVALPEGKPSETGARVELDDLGIRLSASTAGDAFLLYLQKPIVLGGMIVTEDGEGLFVERVHGDSLDLSFRGDANLRLRGAPFRARAGCMDVGPERAFWSDEASLAAAGVAASSRVDRMLAADHPVGLSSSPGGAVIADLAESETGALGVELLEQRGQWARIWMWMSGGGAVFGWVDASALAPPPHAAPGATGTLGHGGGFGQPVAPGTECPRDVPLFAEVAGTQQEVGTLHAGLRFDVGRSATTEHTQVRLRSYRLELLPDSRWLVRTDALADCKVQ